jgi:hypothetical protein
MDDLTQNKERESVIDDLMNTNSHMNKVMESVNLVVEPKKNNQFLETELIKSPMKEHFTESELIIDPRLDRIHSPHLISAQKTNTSMLNPNMLTQSEEAELIKIF